MYALGTDAPPSEQHPMDLRLLTPAIAVWGTAFLVMGNGSTWGWWMGAATAGAGALVAVVGLRRWPAAQMAVGMLACAATAALVCGVRLAAVEDSPVVEFTRNGHEMRADVEVTAAPRARAEPGFDGRPRFTVEARTLRVGGGGVPEVDVRVPVVLLGDGAEWGRLVPGERLRVSGAVLPAGDGLVRGLVLVRGPPETIAEPGPWQRWAAEVRARTADASAGLPAPADGLLPAFVVGDATRVADEVAEDFRDAGMTHLMVVSGSHIALLAGAALVAGRWCRLPPLPIAFAGTALIAVMVLVAGPGPSVLRAAVMGLIALIAVAAGRGRTGLAALSAAVIVLVLLDPSLARSHGFALSVLASGAIMVLAPAWSRAMARYVPVSAAEPIAVALAAHLACLPVLVLLQPEVGWASVPANAAATPFVPVAMVGGFATAVLAMLWPAAAAIAAWVPGAAIMAIAAIAETAAELPYASLPWRGDTVGALAIALVIGVLLVLHGRARIVVITAAAAVALTTCAVPAWPPRGWVLAMCDIGQGDALVLSAGASAAAVVDTGQEPELIDGCLTELGVDEIRALVLTHGDADHVGGTTGALADRSVEAAVVPVGFSGPEAASSLQQADVPMHPTSQGDVWTVGAWTLRVLWPPSDPPEDPNDGSVVLHATWNPPDAASALPPITALLTGDVEEPAQRRLLGEPLIRGVDLLKTPHHGAATQDGGFLTATRPRAVLTSVGADNRYGHPDPETTGLIESLTSAHYRTDLHGTVAVVPTPDGPGFARAGPRRE